MRGLPEVATDFSLLAAAVTWHALAFGLASTAARTGAIAPGVETRPSNGLAAPSSRYHLTRRLTWWYDVSVIRLHHGGSCA